MPRAPFESVVMDSEGSASFALGGGHCIHGGGRVLLVAFAPHPVREVVAGAQRVLDESSPMLAHHEQDDGRCSPG